MPDIVDELTGWARNAGCDAMAADLVPGTTAAEREALAALGGLVRGVVGTVPSHWPEALKQWAEAGPAVPAEVLTAARYTFALTGRDIFAATYERLVAGPSRRRLGTFFTPGRVVELMLERAERALPEPSLVVDPGAGVGAFSLAARRRWPKVPIAAIDVNIVTLGLLAARAKVDDDGERLELIHADYLAWLGRQGAQRGPKLLLGNPPYTRHQELDAKSKAAAMEAAAGLVDSGLAGLSAYFLAVSLKSLRDEDALCFVLPGSWAEARYGRRLRGWLWTHTARPVELLAFPTAVDVFPGTQVTTVILVVAPAAQGSATFTVENVALNDEYLEIRRTTKHVRTGAPPSTFGSMLWPGSPQKERTVLLSTIARVRRGVATGANNFFFLTDEARSDLPEQVLAPGLCRLRHVTGDILDTEEHARIGSAGYPRWLLSLQGPIDISSAALRRRLADGIEAGYHNRYLARDREYWYAVEQIDPPHILASLMTKDRFRAVVNAIDVIPSNSIYGIYMNNPDLVPVVCEWLNSDKGQEALRARARHYSNGLLKLEPNDYLDVRVPDDFKEPGP
jgi:hypothetical protein